MTDAADAPLERIVITREGLANGSLLANFRARMAPGTIVRSDAEIVASLQATLARRDPAEDVWVFGYGSLMWNPAFHYAERRLGVIRGWHRRFCFWIEGGRGTPDNPGLMMGLDRGGTCRGIAFRIPAAQVEDELLLIWRREMAGTAYHARWVEVRLPGCAPVQAITFTANRAYARYAGKVDEAEAARHIATAAGSLGTCRAYLEDTMSHLAELDVRDAGLERIAAAMRNEAAR